jgi:hypothetical protein
LILLKKIKRFIIINYLGNEYKAILHFNLGTTLFLLDKIFFGLKELDRALIIEVKIGDIMIKKG